MQYRRCRRVEPKRSFFTFFQLILIRFCDVSAYFAVCNSSRQYYRFHSLAKRAEFVSFVIINYNRFVDEYIEVVSFIRAVTPFSFFDYHIHGTVFDGIFAVFPSVIFVLNSPIAFNSWTTVKVCWPNLLWLRYCTPHVAKYRYDWNCHILSACNSDEYPTTVMRGGFLWQN